MITNCGPDVPFLWSECPLRELMDTTVFSCQARIRKPDETIYRRAARDLLVDPADCVYVGDGSSEELTGAARVGMLPILKMTSLDDVYDKARSDVSNWEGKKIREIDEIVDLVTSLQQ